MKHPHLLALATVFALAFGGVVQTQEPAARTPAAKPALTPLKVQIVISRYRGDKKVSNVPYMLSVNANGGGRASLRMGAQVPILTFMTPKDTVPGPMSSVQYKDIGTNIDCTASSTDDGRFKVDINIDDSSVYADGQSAEGVTKVSDIPSFRSFRSSESVILKDGQTTEFTAATDRVNGEVTKVDVTLTVIK